MTLHTITEIFAERKAADVVPFSLEMFPPKGELTLDVARELVADMLPANPDFISVTCSAGGSGNGTGGMTDAIASMIKDEAGIPSVAHITCASATKSSINNQIEQMKSQGICNVLALRGDLTDGQEPEDFHFAYELIPVLKDAGFCVGAAAYPEGHIDCLSRKENIEHLKVKQDSGADFFVTQLCFDNDAFLRFREDAASAGITVPITCGIMPFLAKSQLERMVFMCGSSLPSSIIKLIAKYKDDPTALRQAGIDYACEQLVKLGEAGVDGLHIYSMNQPDIAIAASHALSETGLRQQ